jgi:transcriptional regulator GlxA family with amidase domain
VSADAARQLRNTIAHVHDHVLADPASRQAPLIVATAAQLLAVSVLNTFPSTALLEPTTGDRCDAHPATVRRAIAYIDAHAADPITLTDIARGVGVTPRAVQLAFRRHLDISPMAYLRRVRLDHAHHDLAQASPGNGNTVTAVAYRWGSAAQAALPSTTARSTARRPATRHRAN